ncbi:MAG: PHP domain-containing protein, partial [Chlamydiia bacterium]|nr:PHP domain-containing protein [Chlamydiia bacterium]
ITDHDTLAAYTPELFEVSKSLGIELLVGVELSTEYQGVPVHLLGYAIELASSSFSCFLKSIREKRVERNRAILKRLKNLNIELDEKMLQGETIGRPHIAKALMDLGVVSSVQEAFQCYLKDGASCAVSGFRTTPAEAIQEIKRAGGKAVLAHPHFYPKGRFLKGLLNFPWDGIECYYSLLHKERELPWVELTKKKGWIVTGGSDYHGSLKPQLSLGASWVGRESFDALCLR